MIWLIIYTGDNNKNYQEYHIKYEGHKTLESAKNEMQTIFSRMIKQGLLPYPYEIYENDSESPNWGAPSYRLDELDFNFYRDPTQEEIAKQKKMADQLEDELTGKDREEFQNIRKQTGV